MTTNMPSSFFDWVLFLLKEYGGLLVEGAIATLMLAVVGTFIGCIIGLIVGAIQTIKVNPKANPVKKALNKGLQTLLT